MRDFGLNAFKSSEVGRKVAPILHDREIVRDMIALCRHDIPAVRAVGKSLLAIGLKPRDAEAKKHIGRWVREIMEAEGWIVLRKGKVPRGNLFSTGAVYRPKTASAS